MSEVDVGGRPTKYSSKLSKDIVRRICEGESVKSICKDEDMPARSTVMLWVANDRKGFSDIYDKACSARAHYWADEMLDICDNGSNDWMERLGPDGQSEGWKQNGEAINRSRLRVDTRKWLLSKLLRKYSDKVDIDLPDDVVIPIKVEIVAVDASKPKHTSD